MTRPVKILWLTFLSGFLFIILLFSAISLGLFGSIPSIEDLQHPDPVLATEIYTEDGVLMGKYYAENRSEVKFSEISPHIIHALLASEDERFYRHSGIDAVAIGRAISSHGKKGGGSTLTQQLAKMILKQGNENKFMRIFAKLKEWVVAVKLERNFTKEEIITLYLNRAPWGNVYGIRNASLTWFQKEPRDITIEEAAVLIAMLRSTIYDPFRHPKNALLMRNTIINKMASCDYHFITPAEAAEYKALPLNSDYNPLDVSTGMAPYFRDILAFTLKEWCYTHKNPKTGESYNLYMDGLKVYTTINSTMQLYAEDAVATHMPIIQAKLNSNMRANGDRIWQQHKRTLIDAMHSSDRWANMAADSVNPRDIEASFYRPVKMKVFAWNDEHELDTLMTPFDSIRYHKQFLQTSFAAMDPHTGEIKCWVGGINYKYFKLDHVTRSRQVGSAIKPFLYTLALTDAGYTPGTMIPGGDLTLGGKTISGEGGTMAYCLAWSKNIAAWRMIGQIGIARTISFLRTCGINVPLPSYYSIALGAAEIPLTEMLRAYSIFPGRGLNTSPVMLSRIEDKDGNILQTFQATTHTVIGERDAYTMVRLMQGVVQYGTARGLNAYDIPVEKAGKTGTTTGNTDGWFIGYTPELLAGTWVGCDDPFLTIYKSATAGGSEMAAPNWGLFMQKTYADPVLHYGRIRAFASPAILTTPDQVARAKWKQLFMDADTTNHGAGTGDAPDLIDLPADTTTPGRG